MFSLVMYPCDILGCPSLRHRTYKEHSDFRGRTKWWLHSEDWSSLKKRRHVGLSHCAGWSRKKLISSPPNTHAGSFHFFPSKLWEFNVPHWHSIVPSLLLLLLLKRNNQMSDTHACEAACGSKKKRETKREREPIFKMIYTDTERLGGSYVRGTCIILLLLSIYDLKKKCAAVNYSLASILSSTSPCAGRTRWWRQKLQIVPTDWLCIIISLREPEMEHSLSEKCKLHFNNLVAICEPDWPILWRCGKCH